jgi:hypothetical protein
MKRRLWYTVDIPIGWADGASMILPILFSLHFGKVIVVDIELLIRNRQGCTIVGCSVDAKDRISVTGQAIDDVADHDSSEPLELPLERRSHHSDFVRIYVADKNSRSVARDTVESAIDNFPSKVQSLALKSLVGISILLTPQVLQLRSVLVVDTVARMFLVICRRHD